MDFAYSPRTEEFRTRLRDFMDRYVIPNNTRYRREVAEGQAHPAVVDELKGLAKSEGLWNLFLPDLEPDEPGTKLTNLEYAPLAEIMGQLDLGFRSVQLLGARHRQHGAPASQRDARAARALVDAFAQRRHPLVLCDDRARRRVLRRDKHLHRASKRTATIMSSTAASGSSPARGARAAKSRSSWA